MHSTILGPKTGSFVVRGSRFSYAPFNIALHSHLIINYMCHEGKYIHYNDGDFSRPEEFIQRMREGFYKHSLVVSDSETGKPNSIVVFYEDEYQDSIGYSIIPVENKRTSVPCWFAVSYWYEYIDKNVLFMNTIVPYIIQLHVNGFGFLNLNPNTDEYAITKKHLKKKIEITNDS